MLATKVRAAFAEVAGREPVGDAWYDRPILTAAATAWLLEALALVEGTLGKEHAISRAMSDAVQYVLSRAMHGPEFRTHAQRLTAARGAFTAAKQIVDSDRVEALIDLARATTEMELLDQAVSFLDAQLAAAAAVVTGGALETHLRRLVERYQLPWQKHGQPGISSYKMAITAYRKTSPNALLYAAASDDLISGWAKIRNDAAHRPIEFPQMHSAAAVRQMIEGVRLLLAG